MVIVFDLDDTLYDEIDFVKSGFREISRYLGNNSYYDFMLDDFLKNGSGTIFNNLIKQFKLNIPLQKLIEIYRFHRPEISLPKESIDLLDFAMNYQTALITDGHYIMQKNKYNVLELNLKYPVFTDFYKTKKPEIKPFKMVMQYFKNEKKFVYISDNPVKDFIAPHKLNWETIRYRNPVGIYKNYPSDATFDVDDRNKILEILKDML